MSRELDLDALVLLTAVVLLVGALAVATVPGLGVLVPSPLRGVGEIFGASIVSWLVAIALALAALVGLGQLKGRHRAVTGAEDADDGDGGGGGGDPIEDGEAGSGSPGVEAIVGGTLTEEFLRRRDQLRSRSGPSDPGPTGGLEHAAVAVQLARGHDAETAHERLRRGEWTDDPVAAAFLGDETAGSLSFRRRLYAVIYPDRAFERRFERTLEELETVAGRTTGIGGTLDGHGDDDAAASDTEGDTGGAERDNGGARGDAGGQRDGTDDGSDRAGAEQLAGGT